MEKSGYKKILVTTFGTIFLLTGGFKVGVIYAKASMENKTYPYTWLNDIDLGGLSEQEIKSLLKSKIDHHLNTEFEISFEGKVVKLTPYQLGLNSPYENLVNQIKIISSETSDFTFIQNLISSHQLEINPQIDEEILLSNLKNSFPEIFISSEDAKFFDDNGSIKVSDHRIGTKPLLKPIIDSLKKGIISLNQSNLEIELESITPQILSSDLEPLLPGVEKILSREFELDHRMINHKIKLAGQLDWLTLDESKKNIQIEEESFSNWFNQEVAPSYEVIRQDAKISVDENGKISFEGLAKKGEKVDTKKLAKIISDSLLDEDIKVISLPIIIEEPNLEIDESLKEKGITNLIGSGYTDFRGSTSTRIHNIHTGLNRFNGILVAPGETFSMVANLGPVDASTGYKKELVIMGSETKKEFGGGLCQVSSTAFRAALFTGLPIVERSPHSYAVGYYARPGGQGLDAAIYPGSKDLKFMNDTDAYILLQTGTEETLAFFNIYGTPTNREVIVNNYRTWNWKSAPEEQIVYTTELEPGKKEVKEQAIKGFEAAWDRTIKYTATGEEKQETIQSIYKPWAKKTLIGVESAAVESENGLNFNEDFPI